MTGPVDFDRTRQIQWEASDPAASAWVVANAGSGKTHVLTQRVVRLLLSGAAPASILCLTFTKTAAAEMSRRIFDLLARWATLDAAGLAAEIEDRQGRAPTEIELARARRLFARALETPGGLKIQTIHAFCEKLLHQFPFEANVPGRFDILDDVAAAALLAEARAGTMARAARGGRLGAAIRHLAETCTDAAIARALDAAIAGREDLRTWLVAAANAAGPEHEAAKDEVSAAAAVLRARLGLEPDETSAAICREICRSEDWGEASCGEVTDALVAALADAEHAYDRRAHSALSAIVSAPGDPDAARSRLDFFLMLKGGDASPRKISARFSAAFRQRLPDLDTRFEAEAGRLLALAAKLNAARAVEATQSLLVVADAILDSYHAAKRRAGSLDFSDLIVKARDLLSRADAAEWVRYKLDQGLDHILVDEAQDTSPSQWSIVEALAADFFAGASAHAATRTLFAVGDDKQSIFGFQGAAPQMLADMQRLFESRARGADLPFNRRDLGLSFRSTQEVLGAVDAVFGTETAEPVSAWDYVPHSARRQDEPGEVVIWPRRRKVKAEEPEDWTAALDEPTAAEAALAKDIAGEIGRRLGAPLPSGKRLEAGEVLILVRKRDAFVAAMNRALRDAGIPAAGSDRVAVASHIAALDLLALADVVLMPEDDLQLAALLKSPLLGLDEDDLFRAAQDRGHRTLLAALREADDAKLSAAAERIGRWRGRADNVTPFRFFARILGPDGGRRAFRARLGGEVDDVLDAFLALALDYERRATPTLQSFVAFVRANEGDIRREPEEKGGGVRVMTVHGAKGLEADMVFLVDTGGALIVPGQRGDLVPLAGAPPAFLWRRRKDEAPALQAAADEEADRETRREYRRLLYVGMTRARDVLHVCGIAGDRTPPECWYQTIAAALVPDDVGRDEAGDLLAPFHWPTEGRPAREPKGGDDEEPGPAAEPPAWLAVPAPPPPRAPVPLRPSEALAEPDDPPASPAAVRVSSSGPGEALLRGRAVHLLLERLPAIPRAERRTAAERLLSGGFGPAGGEREALIAEALGVLDHPPLGPVFAADARAEVAIIGEIATPSGAFAVSGQIDRLVRNAGGWHIVDFKSDRAPPAPPASPEAIEPAYVLQLALYRRLLMEMAPGESVEVSLVYTAGPRLFPLPAERLDAAIAGLLRA